jgi:UDP-N-acetylglucosamine:LPS N-acetylglucosamine transferase
MEAQEAVYCGVPMVGIPFVSDQKLNMQNLASKGVAVVLDTKHITGERLLTALQTVLYDPRWVHTMSASPFVVMHLSLARTTLTEWCTFHCATGAFRYKSFNTPSNTTTF